MRQAPNWLVPVFLVTAFFSQSTLTPGHVGYGLSALVLAATILWAVTHDKLKFHVTRRTQAIFFVIAGGFLFNLIRNPTPAVFLRALTFTGVTYFVLFFLPQIASWRSAWYRFAALTAALAVISSPTLLVDHFGIGPFTISAWHTTTALPAIDATVNTFSGVFINPNALAEVSCIAALSSMQFIREGHRPSVGLFLVNATATLLAGGRAGIAALCFGIGLFVAYDFWGRRGVTTMTLAGAMGGVVGFVLLFGGLPVQFSIDLSGRKELWIATVRAVLDNPLGVGPGILGDVLDPYTATAGAKNPHNGYLKVLLSGGVLAGLAYVWLYGIAVRRAMWSVDRTNGISVYILLVATMIIGLFSGSSAFGLSAVSVVSALVLGYALRVVDGEHNSQPFRR